MLVKLIVVFVLIFFSEGYITEIALTDNEVFTLTCTYDKYCDEYIVFKAIEGYILRIIVKSVDINGANGDFLLIKSGAEVNDGTSGRIFMYHLDSEKEYISVSNTVLIQFHRVNGGEYDNNNHEGFILTAERLGDGPSSNTEQTTEVIFPSDISRYLTVSMMLKLNISDAIPIFCETVAKIATTFTIERLHLFGSNLNISPENVNIIRIIDCPPRWPQQENCLKITFMLPISISDQKAQLYGQYQLSEYYLRKMWTNASNYFTGPYLYVYELSDHRHYFILWISVICGFIVVFGISYLVIGHICSQRIIRKRRNIKEEDNTFDKNQRNSIIIIEPHHLQGVPSQFENDMSFYDPDAAPHLGRISGLGDPFDDIILDRNNLGYFDNQRRSIPEQNRTNNI